MTYYADDSKYEVKGFIKDGSCCYSEIIEAKDKCAALMYAKRNNLVDRRRKIKWVVSKKVSA